jgi:parallel beta-helix repeat protein
MQSTYPIFRYLAIALLLLGFSAFLPNNLASGASAKVINVKSYGATGNDKTDDTAAIKKAISAARPGDTVYFPSGDYLHSTSLEFSNISVSGQGEVLSHLISTNPVNSAIVLSGERVSISQISVSCNTTSDSTAYLANGIWVNLAKVFSISNVRVGHVSANCISVSNSSSGVISNCDIRYTNETGVYLQNSIEITVQKNSIDTTSTAVYVNNSAVNSNLAHNINIISNGIINTSGGNGCPAIYVVGVHYCTIASNNFMSCAFGGILVQGDNVPGIGNTSDVMVANNNFISCAFYGNVYIESNSGGSSLAQLTVQNVTVANNQMNMVNPSFGIVALGANPGTMSGINILNNTVANVPSAPGILVGSAGSTNISGNTVSQTGCGSIYLGPGNNGSFVINNNKLQNCGPNGASYLLSAHNAVIDLEPNLKGGTSLTSVVIENNSYSGSTTGLADFIFDGAPAHLLKNDAINGNTTTTMLPTIVTP